MALIITVIAHARDALPCVVGHDTKATRRQMPVIVLVMLAACTTSKPAQTMKPIEFLTRDGCANTQVVRGRLDEALKSLKVATTYAVVDLDALPRDDARTGYPTPTILVGGADLLGMARPTPPYPEPT